ncbi:MAG: phage/plasmid replication protein [Muribaculaceae bacterium]
MFDTINFRITQDEAGSVDFIEEIPCRLDNVGEHFFNGCHCISGCLNGLKVMVTRYQVKVKDGSICKFAFGNNYQTMGRRDTQSAIELLSDTLHLPMHKATVTRLDIAQNIVLKHPPAVYLNHLGELRHATRLQEPTGLYYNLNGGRLCFYDKNREQANHRGQIPDLYKGRNVLRYEQRYTQRIASKLGVPEVTGKLLYNEAFYITLLDRWRDTYKAIHKINDIILNFKAMKNKRQLHKMGVLSMVERVGGEVEMINQINEAQKRGDLTSKQAFDLRKEIREACKVKEGLTVESEAIAELDKKIIEAVMYYR